MQGAVFMQLLIILALLMCGGRNNAQNILKEVKPVLETIGGEDVKAALKSAEEISEVLSAITGSSGGEGQPTADRGESFTTTRQSCATTFPLEPINNFVDRDISYSLSKYIATAN